jgi:hypothetical protein
MKNGFLYAINTSGDYSGVKLHSKRASDCNYSFKQAKSVVFFDGRERFFEHINIKFFRGKWSYNLNRYEYYTSVGVDFVGFDDP